MRRTELIPQTTATINSGKVWYHFSIKKAATNQPSIYREHQINFFESHFTELKSGWISGASGNSNPALQWFVGGQSKWSVTWEADVWHNVAYEIVRKDIPYQFVSLTRRIGFQCRNGRFLALYRFRCVDSHRRSR